MMMRRAKPPSEPAFLPMDDYSPVGSAAPKGEWEVRPGGMLVQKRDPGPDTAPRPAPTIRVKVKYGAASHEIYLSSQASFGELKKVMSERISLHPLDQKVVFKGKERDAAAFLDLSGVKDGSKMVILEDPIAQAKRLLETRRQAKMEKASKSIASIRIEVDHLACKVNAFEGIVAKGGKVVERDVLNLIEMLMTQLVQLDGIVVEGDLKLQKEMQVRRVQKYVVALDVIKIKNVEQRSNGQHRNHQQETASPAPETKRQPLPSAVVTTKWEAFDSLFSPTASVTTSSSSSTATSGAPTPRFDWELF